MQQAIRQGAWWPPYGGSSDSCLPRPFAVAAESGAGLGVGLELCVPNLGGLRTILGISCLSSRPRTCVVGMWCVSKELLRGQAGAQGQLVGCPLQT